MQEHRKMASVEDYPFDQSVFKFSNPPTADSLSFGFPANQLEYFSFGQAQAMDPNSSYSINDPLMANMDPITSSGTPNLGQLPQVFLSNSNFLDLDQPQPQHQHPQLAQQQQQPQQLQAPSLDALSSTATSVSNVTPFDPAGSNQASSTHFSNTGFISEDSVFPPVDAFIPSSIDTTTQQQHQQQQQQYQRSRYLSEPNIMSHTANDSPFSLSPQSTTFGSTIEHQPTTYNTNQTSYESDIKPLYQRYRVIRGISSGGSATKPPRIMTRLNHHYVPVNLDILDAQLQECCLPAWNENEKADKRRIIRIERFQVGSKIVAQFSIVGSAKENPQPKEAQPGVDVVEVSCLECFTKSSEDTDVEDDGLNVPAYSYGGRDETKRSFYITSVEVIKIVELLIGTEVQDPAERRRERGRIRSNLVPFWSKRPISSRMSNNDLRSNSSSPNGSFTNDSSSYNSDFRVELATRIMAYDIRKPRGFDKEVRILKWEKLVPALRRALQSYYVEIPDGEQEY